MSVKNRFYKVSAINMIDRMPVKITKYVREYDRLTAKIEENVLFQSFKF